jgi:hypothetical protein
MKTKREPAVRLRKHPTRWQRVPSSVREALHQGRLRVDRLCEDIARQAGVPNMPPVDIFAEVWMSGADLIHGKTGAVEREGKTLFGAHLPAPTVSQPDDEVLRAILVHEFNHCLAYMVYTAEEFLDGRKISGMASLDGLAPAASEEAAMLKPSEWFGRDDAERFLRWEDQRIDALEPVAAQLAEVLPVVSPTSGFRVHSLDIPSWVVERVRARLRRDGALPTRPRT